jgi:hypothetical protein
MNRTKPEPEPLPAESPDGVDLTLIRWTLSLGMRWTSS